MSDPLSVTASAFAVVGLADVVSRASKGCYQFLCAIRDAPSDVQQLKYCIEETALLLQSTQKYCNELKTQASAGSAEPPTARAAPSHVISQFTLALRGLQREFLALDRVAKKHKAVASSWGKLKWVFDERRLGQSLSKLQNSKSTLAAALLLAGRYQDIAFQQNTEIQMRRNLQDLTSSVENQLKTFTTTWESRNDISPVNRSLKDGFLDLHEEAKRGQERLLAASQRSSVEHRKTRNQIDRGINDIIQTICSKLDNLPQATRQVDQSAMLSNRQIHFFGETRVAMLGPLLHLVPFVQWALMHIRTHHSNLVSMRHLSWLQSEFQNLVASATQEVAATSQGSTATPFDEWIYSESLTDFVTYGKMYKGTSATRKRVIDRSKSTAVFGRAEAGKGRKRLKSTSRALRFHSSTGTLLVMLPQEATDSDASSQLGCSDGISLLFLPSSVVSSIISSTVIEARFKEYMDFASMPRLYAQLKAFKMISTDEEWYNYNSIIADCSTKEIDLALRNRSISPYAADETGQNLCISLAAVYCRLDVLVYLDSQGVGPSSLSGDSSALSGLADLITTHLMPDDLDNVIAILTYLDKSGKISPSIHSHSLLHSGRRGTGRSQLERSSEVYRTFKIWVELLKEEEYDFEILDKAGITPLLDYLSCNGDESLIWVSLLLEYGANAHALGACGMNALWYAMDSSRWEKHRDILEQKLYLLIKAGVDIKHRCMHGLTPSIYAREYRDCWTEWCNALRRNGISIQHLRETETTHFPWEEDENTLDDNESQLKLIFGEDWQMDVDDWHIAHTI